jgi:hypothetical protein
MIIKFKYGFYEGDVLFGWHQKHPYRLPQIIGDRFYPLHKVGVYKARNLYYINGKLRSLKQLESMTVVIDKEVQLVRDEDCPF